MKSTFGSITLHLAAGSGSIKSRKLMTSIAYIGTSEERQEALIPMILPLFHSVQ